MSPIRLVILAVLFYLLYRLIFSSGKKKKKQAGREGGAAIQDVLVKDPVCHSYVAKGQAVTAIYKGETYYFCSDACCRKFLHEQKEN